MDLYPALPEKTSPEIQKRGRGEHKIEHIMKSEAIMEVFAFGHDLYTFGKRIISRHVWSDKHANFQFDLINFLKVRGHDPKKQVPLVWLLAQW